MHCLQKHMTLLERLDASKIQQLLAEIFLACAIMIHAYVDKSYLFKVSNRLLVFEKRLRVTIAITQQIIDQNGAIEYQLW